MGIAHFGLLLCAWPGAPAATPQTVSAEQPKAAEAKAFIDKVNPELRAHQIKSSTAEWIKNTYLTDDTERSAAQANEASLAYQTAAVKEAARFKDVPALDANTARMLEILRTRGAGPSDPARRLELTTVAAKLSGIYGNGKWGGPDGKRECKDLEQLSVLMAKSRIPDHLLGNMWAQEWTNIYPLVEPYPVQHSLDVDGALAAQKWDWKRMVKTGEGFYPSLGLDPLPPTFWERSMFVKPRDREVICHASAWDVLDDNDLRIKTCIKPSEEDLQMIHHELGHNYYQHYHYKLPFLLQGGAHDGFHKATANSTLLSMTPRTLHTPHL